LDDGADGIDIITRNITFARQIAGYLNKSPSYELLNPSSETIIARDPEAIIPMNIVLFRGSPKSAFPSSDPDCGAKLAAAINATRKMYVTGTKWRGQSAVRLAVSNWRSGGPGELDIIKAVLEEVAG
jgi:glutamate/tyrosine decarboxylase-like PLP-dependent enzyme